MAKEKAEMDGNELFVDACKAYDIDPKHVLSFKHHTDTGELVILTNGGSKVRFKAGDKVKPLSQIAVTGVNPKWAEKKVIAGKAKK